MHFIKNLAVVVAFLGSQACAQTPAKSPSQPPPPSLSPPSLPRPETLHVSGSGPRPLDRAIQDLRLKYGWAVNYEDPPFLYGKDVAEANGSVLPAGTPFTVDLPSAALPAEGRSLQLIVDAYNRSGNPGQFEVRKDEGNLFSVVGVAARNVKAVLFPQTPLLDSTITLPVQEQTIADTVDSICKLLADQIHAPVSLGVTPRALVDHTKAKLGGTKIPARTLLAQALAAATGRTLYWQLLFDPNSKGYLLNIHLLHPAKTAADDPGKPPPRSTVHP